MLAAVKKKEEHTLILHAQGALGEMGSVVVLLQEKTFELTLDFTVSGHLISAARGQ